VPPSTWVASGREAAAQLGNVARLKPDVYRQLYELEDRHWWFQGRRAVIWALLRRAGLPAAPRVLDAGCGTGRNLLEFGSLGSAEGVDPSEDAVAFCRRRGLDNVRRGSLESLPFEEDSFDLLLATDVIEHIDDDEAALRELRRVARPDARLVITVPAYGWLWTHHDEDHHHKRRYTRRLLFARVRANGWRPATVSYFNSTLLPPIAAVRLLERVRRKPSPDIYDLTPGRLNGLLAAPMRAEARLIERGVRFPAGVSVGMICTPEPDATRTHRAAAAPAANAAAF
jgi:SAM-dependent methyltransferase